MFLGKQVSGNNCQRKRGGFEVDIESACKHTEKYANDPDFQQEWFGNQPECARWSSQQRIIFSRLIHPVFPTFENRRILDFGCGTGHRLNWLVDMGADLTSLFGVDISQTRIAQGQRNNPALSIKMYDGHTIPFQDNQFDLVMSWAVFSSISNPQLRLHLAKEIARVVAPGGFIFWWDLPHMVAPIECQNPLDPASLWPSLRLQRQMVASHPRPSEGIRSFRGLKRFLTPLLDFPGYPPSYLAVLLGPV